MEYTIIAFNPDTKQIEVEVATHRFALDLPVVDQKYPNRDAIHRLILKHIQLDEIDRRTTETLNGKEIAALVGIHVPFTREEVEAERVSSIANEPVRVETLIAVEKV